MTGSNCYLVEASGEVVIIDPNDAERIEKCLDDKGWQPVRILLTHEHCDHTQGLEKLRAVYGIPVTCSAACSRCIGDSKANMSRRMEVYMYFKSQGQLTIHYEPFECRPAEEVFEGDHSFAFHGHEFRMRELPGHSGGSEVIWLDDDIFFSGDYLLPETAVVTRLPGGSEADYQTVALPYLKALPEGTRIHPGARPAIYFTVRGDEMTDRR